MVPGLYREYSEAIADLPHGEYLQIKARKTIQSLDKPDYPLLWEEYLEKSHYKTGSLFTHLLLGTALVTRVNPSKMDALEKLGLNLGLSFQIADDLKDVKAGDKTKDCMNDLKERNTTAPYLHALMGLHNQGSITREKDLLKILKKEKKTNGELEFVMECIQETGSEQKTRDMIHFHYKEAQEAFNEVLGKENENKEVMRVLQEFSTSFLKI